MFGAQVHQLPEIWEKLINAGFELDMLTANPYVR